MDNLHKPDGYCTTGSVIFQNNGGGGGGGGANKFKYKTVKSFNSSCFLFKKNQITSDFSFIISQVQTGN